MGNYLNPGNSGFMQDSQSPIYVDKTGLLGILNGMLGTAKNCVALSHARRFGKSQAARMLDAYYSCGCDSRELFAPFEIVKDPGFETHLNKYNVIHVDVQSVLDFHKEDLVESIIEELRYDFSEAFEGLDLSRDIHKLLKTIASQTGLQFVIILDEWDCVIRSCADRPELVHKYLQFLHALFKSEESRSFLALGYITGILPIKKIEDESALNNFSEYTMLNSRNLTPYFGFTEAEVQALCAQYDMEYDSIRKWYNGYLISGRHMYNPNSVYEAMVNQSLESYWKNTSAFGTINRYITMDFEGLKEDVLRMLEGGRVPVNTRTFQNDLSEIRTRDEALTALIHLGYLAYDADFKEAYIPNFEVSEAYLSALETGSWTDIARTISKCEELLNETIRRNEVRVAELIDLAHETYTSVLKYNDENALSCVITMAYFTAPAYYNIVREMPAGKGFADFAFIPRKEAGTRPAMIVELKYDQSADAAIRQLKEKRYAGALQGYEKEILLVGINYDRETKQHQCVIEKISE